MGVTNRPQNSGLDNLPSAAVEFIKLVFGGALVPA